MLGITDLALAGILGQEAACAHCRFSPFEMIMVMEEGSLAFKLKAGVIYALLYEYAEWLDRD
jgi:hypothetical protein